MTKPRIDYDKAARALVDAAYSSDEDAAKRHGVHRNTIINWRKRLADDPQLVQVLAEKKELADAEWLATAPKMLSSALAYMERCCSESPPDAEMLRCVAGAFKIVHEALVLSKLLDARLSSLNHPCR